MLYWETLDASERSQAALRSEWQLPSIAMRSGAGLRVLEPREVLGYAGYLRAIRWERTGNPERAINALKAGLEGFPNHVDAQRELAWLIATDSTLVVRDHALALANAQTAVSHLEDSDSLDTLAAVLASCGRFEEAERQERRAIAQGGGSKADRAAYRWRLRLYGERRPFRVAPERSATAHQY